MSEKWLNIWKVKYNAGGAGSVPIYFDNQKAAEEFATRDYTSKPARVKANNTLNAIDISVYKSVEDYENQRYYNIYI